MSYGFTDASKVETNTVQQSQAQAKVDKEKKKMEAKRKAQEPPTWFEVDEAHNTAIYVSGLPLDITMDELTELFNKCGLIARDEKGKDKVKLYKDTNGQPKGDALCIYIKVSDYLFGFVVSCFINNFIGLGLMIILLLIKFLKIITLHNYENIYFNKKLVRYVSTTKCVVCRILRNFFYESITFLN